MLEILVTTTALICAVLLIRGMLGRRIPAGARYGLWGLVLVRLLVPVTFFHSPASVMNAVPGGLEVGGPSSVAAEPRHLPPQGEGLGTVAEGLGEALPSSDGASPRHLPPGEGLGVEVGGPSSDGASLRQLPPERESWAFGVWLAGALAVGGWFLVVNLGFYGRLRRSRRRVDIQGCPVAVYRADFLPSPCLAGLFRPAVYLNAAAMERPDGLPHILTHELCHRRHGDNLWALLRSLCLALWWFHPLVWVAAVLSKRDCELFCDAAAVKALGEAQRIPYGRTLVDMVAARRPGPGDLLCASTAMTEGKRQIKERVVRVTDRKKTTKAALAAALVLALLAGLCTFTGAVQQSVPSQMPYPVTADPALALSALDLGAVSLPDFDWNGLRTDYNREVGLRWAAEYGKQFYALPEGSPYKAVDVKVIPPVFHPEGLMSLKGNEWYDGKGESVTLSADRDNSGIHGAGGWFDLAVKPVGGMDAVRDLFHGGVPRGTGELSDYIILEYHYDLERVPAPDGGYVWKGAEGGKLVTPAWNGTPPPAFNDWTDELIAKWSEDLPLDVAAVAAGNDRAAWEQAGWDWAERFTRKHRYAKDNGNPAKADDVRLLSMDLQTWEPNDDPQTLFFHLKYAFRPVWDESLARLFLDRFSGQHSGWVDYGTGELEDYLVVDAAVTLVRDEVFDDGRVRWKGFEFGTEYASNYENGMNLSGSFTVPKQAGGEVQAVDPVGVSVAYPAGTDETAIRDLVFSKWATAFAQQFYQLPQGHPLACSKVEVTNVSRFDPTVVTASGMTRVTDGVTGHVWLSLTPQRGVDGAAGALAGKADLDVFEDEDWFSAAWYVTLERGTGADGSVTWTCTASAAEDGSRTGQSGQGPEGLPYRVEPRAGWSISALDYDGVYVPDDGKGDLENRWIEAFGQEFYALPDGDPWKASDVQVRWAGRNLCLAVKPIGGTAALEPYFPKGCPKGSGDLEGYILLQYGVSLRKETIRQFGEAPVWVVITGYAGPRWAVLPPEVGSEDWQEAMDYYWTKFKDGHYASAYAGNGGEAERSAAGTAWAWAYLADFVEFGMAANQPSPVLSDDVKLLSVQVADYNEADRQMKVRFGFAFRPLWGTDVVKAFYGGDVTMGTGDLAGYVVRDQTATLEFRPGDGAGVWDMWFCAAMET